MQTHCPHCDTRFRVTETQINTADGFVRCGVCKEVFNALDVASQQDHQTSLLDEHVSETYSEIDEDTVLVTGTERAVDDHQASELADETDEHIEIEPDHEAVNFNETPATDESRKDAFDFFDEAVNESLPHVVPDQFRGEHPHGANHLVSTILWGIGILFLTLTLSIEYVWFNRDNFNQITEIKTLISDACKRFECANITLRDPSKMELVTRNVYSHPNEKNALIVDITMKNNAEFAQPYPVLQIDFSDIRGGTVAARRFLPGEYLDVEDAHTTAIQQRLLHPEASTSMTLEIQDPGKQAMTYEFNFL